MSWDIWFHYFTVLETYSKTVCLCNVQIANFKLYTTNSVYVSQYTFYTWRHLICFYLNFCVNLCPGQICTLLGLWMTRRWNPWNLRKFWDNSCPLAVRWLPQLRMETRKIRHQNSSRHPPKRTTMMNQRRSSHGVHSWERQTANSVCWNSTCVPCDTLFCENDFYITCNMILSNVVHFIKLLKHIHLYYTL